MSQYYSYKLSYFLYSVFFLPTLLVFLTLFISLLSIINLNSKNLVFFNYKKKYLFFTFNLSVFSLLPLFEFIFFNSFPIFIFLLVLTLFFLLLLFYNFNFIKFLIFLEISFLINILLLAYSFFLYSDMNALIFILLLFGLFASETVLGFSVYSAKNINYIKFVKNY